MLIRQINVFISLTFCQVYHVKDSERCFLVPIFSRGRKVREEARLVYVPLSNDYCLRTSSSLSSSSSSSSSSYVSSNFVSVTMHSHIGCICLIFPNCILSCVSSNYLSDGINSHTGLISTCQFIITVVSYVPKVMVLLTDSKITLSLSIHF